MRRFQISGRKTSVWTREHLFVATDFIDEETELQMVLLDISILFLNVSKSTDIKGNKLQKPLLATCIQFEY